MPDFHADNYFNPGAILSGMNSVKLPDTTELRVKDAHAKALENENKLFPQRQKELQNKLDAERDAATDRAIVMQERQDWQDVMSKYAQYGDKAYSMARPELLGKLRPQTLGLTDKLYDEHFKTAAELAHKRAEAQKILEELDGKEREDIGGIAARIADGGYNPTAADAALDVFGKAHADTEHKAHIDSIRTAIRDNPDRIKELVDSLITPNAAGALQKLKNEQATEAATKANTGKTEAEIPGVQAKSEMEVAQANMLKGMTEADWQTAIDNVVDDKSSRLYRTTTAEVNFYRKKGDLKGASDAIKRAGEQLGKVDVAEATARVTAPIKISVAAAGAAARSQATQDASGLTDEDYQMAGEQYGRTGVMPPLGRDSVTRGKIEHYKSQWARDNGFTAKDLVVIQAAYKGDVESLKKFQVQRDQIVSFEQTAQKNLDMMLEAGQKLLDTGSPWLNKPLRSLNRTGLGSNEQAAFDAAQLIAQNEVAKVTSGGGLGGVVSDTAKREMKEAMGENPTIGNMMEVAKILKRDMANRHGSMDATLGDIRQNIGGQRFAPGQQAGQQQPSSAPQKIGSQQQYDALPSGATYINAGDGKTYRKP